MGTCQWCGGPTDGPNQHPDPRHCIINLKVRIEKLEEDDD